MTHPSGKNSIDPEIRLLFRECTLPRGLGLAMGPKPIAKLDGYASSLGVSLGLGRQVPFSNDLIQAHCTPEHTAPLSPPSRVVQMMAETASPLVG